MRQQSKTPSYKTPSQKTLQFWIMMLGITIPGLIITPVGVMSQEQQAEQPEEEEFVSTSDIPIIDLTKTETEQLKQKKVAPKVEEMKMALAIGEAKVVQVPYEIGRHDVTTTGPFEIKIETGLQDPDGNPFSEVSFQAVKPGSTALRLYDKKNFPRMVFQLSSSKYNVSQIMDELSELLSTVEGIEIKQVGEKVIIDGEILIPRDMQRINMVLAQYSMVVNLARLSPNTQNLYAARMEADIGKPEVKVRTNQGKFIIEGVVENKDEIDFIQKIIQTYIPPMYNAGGNIQEAQTPNIVMLVGVRPPKPDPPEKIIKVVLHYVELNKEYIRAFNFNWSPLLNETSQIKYDLDEGLTGSVTGTITNLFPKLGKAVKLNHARILKTSTLLVKDGASKGGTLSADIDIPFNSGTSDTGDTIVGFKSVSNNVNVIAKTLKGYDQVHLSVSTSVGEVVGESASGQPQTLNNSVNTEVILGKDQSAAIAGLFSESLRRNFDHTPDSQAAGATIFKMGKTKNYAHNRNQFIVFITPEVLAGPNEIIEASEDFKRKFRLTREI